MTMTDDQSIRDELFILHTRLADTEHALSSQRGLMQTYIQELQKECSTLVHQRNELQDRLVDMSATAAAIRPNYERWNALHIQDRLIELDYSVRPRVRQSINKYGFPAVRRIIQDGSALYSMNLSRMAETIERALLIEHKSSKAEEPEWANDWLPSFDAMSIYALLALHNPSKYVEIGSGNSTKFARRAIRDYGLRTQIVSIDPFPRAEVEGICDESIRLPLEDVPLRLFSLLEDDSMVFCDNSHRSFQNSDVTVFFTEVVPMLRPGLLIGVHDVFLPYDYPEQWTARFYNEQYLLACFLMGGNSISIELPVHYCSRTPELHQRLCPLWKGLGSGIFHGGGAFWFRLRRKLSGPEPRSAPEGAIETTS